MANEPLPSTPISRIESPKPITKGNGWGCKRATSVDDALNFLNGVSPYQAPVKQVRICAFWDTDHPEFYVFYQKGAPADTGGWGWKKSTTPDDVRNFLSGSGGVYKRPVGEAQIAAFHKDNHDEFYVFYQRAPEDQPVYGKWKWKLTEDPLDVTRFLNGEGIYRHPVTTARVALIDRDAGDAFYIFYQKGVRGQPAPNWYWKLATSREDVLHFVNGDGGYPQAVNGFDIVVAHNRLHVFANQGNRLWFQYPLRDERFVAGEPVTLQALYTCEQIKEGRNVHWVSDLDGELGAGPTLTLDNLSVGTHQIYVYGYQTVVTRQVRIFADLQTFYQATPSADEIVRIESDFEFNWIDGNGTGELWSAYPDVFDQQSLDPTKLAIYAKLDVMRHQDFVEPLPFAKGKKAYDYFRTFVSMFHVHLDCRYNSGGGGNISLNRGMNLWHGTSTGPGSEACKEPPPNPTLNPYTGPISLLLHEERHSEPDDPYHVTVDGNAKDQWLEGGSGYAWAAMYYMWVYKYGKYDPPIIKEWARVVARQFLSSCFVTPPVHSDTRVQAIIDELLG